MKTLMLTLLAVAISFSAIASDCGDRSGGTIADGKEKYTSALPGSGSSATVPGQIKSIK